MSRNDARYAKWDNLKAVLIVLVVIGHLTRSLLETSESAAKLYIYIYLFHMPAFIFVSGLFAKSAVRKKNYDVVFSYLILYLFIKCLNYFTRMQLQNTVSRSLFTETGTAWYALILAMYILFTIFLQRYSRRYVLILSIVLGCVAGYFSDVGDFMALSRMFAFYPFFLAGFYLDPKDLADKFCSVKMKLVSVLILLFFGVAVVRYGMEFDWLVPLLRASGRYQAMGGMKDFGLLLRLGQYLVAAAFIVALIALTPSASNVFTYLGQRTRAIYSFHYSAILVLSKKFFVDKNLVAHFPRTHVLFLVLIGFLLTLIFSLRIFDNIVKVIIKPGKEEKNGL